MKMCFSSDHCMPSLASEGHPPSLSAREDERCCAPNRSPLPSGRRQWLDPLKFRHDRPKVG